MLFALGIYLKIVIMTGYLVLFAKASLYIAYKDVKMQKDKFIIHRRLSKLIRICTIEGYLVIEYEVMWGRLSSLCFY